MPDWQKLVRQHLSGLALNDAEKDEVQAELASHLEEACEALLRDGIAEGDAVHRALAQVGDWNDLQRKVQSARTKEGTMTSRVTQLWLPGLLTFALTMILLEVVQKFDPRPLIFSLDKGTPILMFYTGWLLALPVAGAIGAYLSKRAGGSLRMVLASSVFPVLPYAAVFLIAGPVGLVMGRNLSHYIVTRAIFTMAFGWVLAPGAALLAGGLLVQLFISRRSGARGIAAS